jgi:hypothetical protein
MTKWTCSVVAALLALPATAAEIRSTKTMRVGEPVQSHQHVVVHGKVDPHDLGRADTPADAGDPTLDVEMDALVVEAGETPRVTARLRRANQRPVTDANVAVDDDRHSRKAVHRGNGEYVADLDGTPGEHTVDVTADAVIDGNSVHRALSYTYEVATGRVRVLGLGPTRQDSTTLHVPLELRCTEKGFFQFEGMLVSGGTAVARAQTTAWVWPGGEQGVELTFNIADLVEPGPYTLSDVTVIQFGPGGPQVATAPAVVGKPIAVGRARGARPLTPQVRKAGQADEEKAFVDPPPRAP